MMVRIKLFWFFLMIVVHLNAQNNYIKYDWIESRDLMNLSPTDSVENEIVLKKFNQYQYIYDFGEYDPVLYITEHEIVKVNSVDAIQRNNKIYISTYNLIEVVDLKARSINPKGEEFIFNKDNIKEIKDEGEETGFKIFAVEGVELGSEIEYFYTKKVYPDYFGRIFIQDKIPGRNFEFRLICPLSLNFKFKVYNDTATVKNSFTDTTRIFYLHINKTNPLFAEEFSYYNPNRARLEFMLSHNYKKSRDEVYTWDHAAQRVYNIIYNFNKNEIHELKSLAKQIKVNSYKSIAQKITAIENYIKTHIYIQEINSAQLTDINFILANGFGNVKGLVRLYAGLFTVTGIKHEIVLGIGRDKVKFDKTFNTWNYLSNYLIFFPEIEKYLTPEDPSYRLGMVPYLLTATDALFIEKVKFEKNEYGKARIDYIPPLSFDKNYDNMYLEVKMDNNFEKSVVNIKREFGGSNAVYIQPFFSFMEEEQKQEVLKSIIKTSAEDAVFKKVEAENTAVNLSLLDYPFLVKAQFESATLIEKAGDKIIFKIGDVIAEQKEMYQENKRITDVENDFNRSYYREINFQIPEGYHIKNPQSIKIKEVYKKNGENIYAFISDYSINDNHLKIVVDEYYKEIFCEKGHFEEFRKVVNAAADFNKIVLVLDKN